MALGLGIGSLALGLGQLFGGLAGGPKGEISRYSISPELQKSYLRGEEMAKQGMTGAERAAYNQSMARARMGGFQRATDVTGGSLAKAISAGLNAQQLDAENQLAIQDAQLRRQNIQQANQMAQQMQQQRNVMTQADRERYMQQEQAAGAAIGGGLTNMTNVLNLNNALSYGGGAGLLGGLAAGLSGASGNALGGILPQTGMLSAPASGGIGIQSGAAPSMGIGIGSGSLNTPTITAPDFSNVGVAPETAPPVPTPSTQPQTQSGSMAQKSPSTNGTEWVGRMMDYEFNSGGFDPKTGQSIGLKNYGYNTANPKSRDEAVSLYKQEYLPKVNHLPQNIQPIVGDYLYNTGRSQEDLMLYAAGIIGLDDINSTKTHTKEWEANKGKIEAMYNDPAFAQKLIQARKDIAKTTGKDAQGNRYTLNNPNPAYEGTWLGRIEMLSKYL